MLQTLGVGWSRWHRRGGSSIPLTTTVPSRVVEAYRWALLAAPFPRPVRLPRRRRVDTSSRPSSRLGGTATWRIRRPASPHARRRRRRAIVGSPAPTSRCDPTTTRQAVTAAAVCGIVCSLRARRSSTLADVNEQRVSRARRDAAERERSPAHTPRWSQRANSPDSDGAKPGPLALQVDHRVVQLGVRQGVDVEVGEPVDGLPGAPSTTFVDIHSFYRTYVLGIWLAPADRICCVRGIGDAEGRCRLSGYVAGVRVVVPRRRSVSPVPRRAALG